MSQVQVRQVPLSSSSDAQRVVGSWFRTGYYGHFRAKSRGDLCNYFRQLAQPTPPKTFLERQHSEATNHAFSRHDNRFKFEGDPLVRGTQSGFGKRKAKTNVRGEFDPLFISWVPKNVDRQAFVDDPKVSSYAEDYNHDSGTTRTLSEIQPKVTLNVQSEQTVNPAEIDLTAYALAYQHGQPNSQQSKEIRRETHQRFLTARTRLQQTKKNDRSPTVASCLVWNNQSDAVSPINISTSNPPMVPLATPITLQPRTNLSNLSPRQRSQSAGPRLISTVPAEIIPPTNFVSMSPPAGGQFQSSSMQIFRPAPPTSPFQRPHTATTTSREHFSGLNFGLKKEPPPRAATSFDTQHNNSMDNLIAKYM